MGRVTRIEETTINLASSNGLHYPYYLYIESPLKKLLSKINTKFLADVEKLIKVLLVLLLVLNLNFET